MKTVLYAFFSESSVLKMGSSFWTTTEDQQVRATHVSRNMNLTDFQGTVTDDYGRGLSEKPEPLPEDLTFVGPVWSDSHTFDYEHMDPNLSWSR